MTIVDELKEREAKHRQPLRVKFRTLLRGGGDVDELGAVAAKLGLDAQTVGRHARALALHGELCERVARLGPEVTAGETRDREFAQMLEDYQAESNERHERQVERIKQARPELVGLESKKAGLGEAKKRSAAIAIAFPELALDRPEDAPNEPCPEDVAWLRFCGLMPITAT